MKKLLRFLAVVCLLMLLNDVIEIFLAHKKRQERIRKEAIDRLKRNRARMKRRMQEKMLNDESGNSMGSSLHNIRDDKSTSLDKRFNTMLTATSFDEFTYHLRQIFKLGKSKNAFSADFPALADDLYWYQNGRSKQICLKWARDYYRPVLASENDQ